MNKSLMLLPVLLASARLTAQTTVSFTANLTLIEPLPPFRVPHSGTGVFSLDGNTFRYRVETIPYGLGGWQSRILLGDPGGPVLFELPLTGCVAPLGRDLGSCSFRGAVEVPDAWIPDLMADRWYVSASWLTTASDIFLSGKIVAVPEPGTVSLLALGAAVAGFWAYMGIRYPRKLQHMK